VAGQASYEGWVVDVAESTGSNPCTDPFVKYQSQTEAETVLGTAGYVIRTVTTQSHNVIPAGCVISQMPGDNAVLAAGGAVDLVISSGAGGATLIPVPDAVGLTQADAETALTDAGLTVNVTTAFSDTVAAGVVISQTPGVGTDVTAGSPVDLVVSSGPSLATVPDVIGTSYSMQQRTSTPQDWW
jgi:beta-lactam-binding protein with PASTA domain